MPLLCSVCETDNPEDAFECSRCGKPLQQATRGDVAGMTVPGLERTLADPVEIEASAIPGLEPTLAAGAGVEAAADRLPSLEPTQLEADASEPSNWTAGVEVDRGRELDLDPRTPAPPETALCPFCGAAAPGAVCDSCGRRKARYAAPSPLARIASSGESRLCPACFARVPVASRCEECGVPFPVQEL